MRAGVALTPSAAGGSPALGLPLPNLGGAANRVRSARTRPPTSIGPNDRAPNYRTPKYRIQLLGPKPPEGEIGPRSFTADAPEPSPTVP
jgi:hypothetical protein